LKFGKYYSMALQNQRAAVDQRAVEIKDDQFQGSLSKVGSRFA